MAQREVPSLVVFSTDEARSICYPPDIKAFNNPRKERTNLWTTK
jgi:hypothetical protein